MRNGRRALVPQLLPGFYQTTDIICGQISLVFASPSSFLCAVLTGVEEEWSNCQQFTCRQNGHRDDKTFDTSQGESTLNNVRDSLSCMLLLSNIIRKSVAVHHELELMLASFTSPEISVVFPFPSMCFVAFAFISVSNLDAFSLSHDTLLLFFSFFICIF